MSEEWRPVAGYEDLYEVSDAGSVRSHKNRYHSGRQLKQWTSGRNPYLQISLCRSGVQTTTNVHRLVCKAFHEAPFKGAVVRHLNGDRLDNRAENLQWGTYSENQFDQVAHRTHRNVNKTHCPRNHPYDLANTYINKQGSRVCRKCRSLAVQKWERDQRAKRRGLTTEERELIHKAGKR